MTEDEAFEEVVCDAAQRMLTDTDAGKKLTEWGAKNQENASIVAEIKKLLTELLEKLRRYFKKADSDSDAANAFRKLDKNVQQILADLFVDMSTDAAEKLGTIKAAGMLNKINTTGEGGVRYKIGNVYADITEQEKIEGEKVADFIEQVNNMLDKAKRSKRKLKIGPISERHLSLINRIMQKIYPNFDASGYTLWVDGTFAAHIEERHGTRGKQDKTMSSREAQVLIPWAAQNATDVDFMYKNGKQLFSDRFFNKDKSKAPEIRLSKKVGENIFYVSECVPDSANKIVWITSAYIAKSSTGQLLNIEEKTSPQPTPEATFDSSATNNNVSPSVEIVNPESTTKSDSNTKRKVSAQPATDSNGNELSEGQQKYFKYSVVRNGSGNLLVMYHGTSRGGFTVFDLFGGNHGL